MSTESAITKYGELKGSIQLVELQKGQTGLGLSLAGNRDRNKMSVFVCGLHPKGSAFSDGRIRGNSHDLLLTLWMCRVLLAIPLNFCLSFPSPSQKKSATKSLK